MKNIVEKIIKFIVNLWHDAKTVINEYAIKSIVLVEGIKKLVESPVSTVIVSLTQVTWDDELLEKAKLWLPKVLVSLNLSKEITEATSIEDQLSILVEYLKTCSPDMQDTIYFKISSLLTKYQTEEDGVGGKFTQSDFDFILMLGYKKWKEETSK